MEIIEVGGIIVDIKYGENHVKDIKIKSIKEEKTINVLCSFFCPVKKYDIIYAILSLIDNKYTIIKSPFVLISKDKNTIIVNIMKTLKIKYYEAKLFYQEIADEALDEANVYEYITSLAQKWNDDKDISILNMFGENLKKYDIIKLLQLFHKEFNLRSLYLLGLNDKEISLYNKTCKKIYEDCLINPYKVYTISMEKCENILNRINKVPATEDKEKGQIIRYIWNNLEQKKWVCTSTNSLKWKFPSIKNHVESLKNDYNIMFDLQTAYIYNSHQIETYIADFITDMIKSDPVSYDSPIEQPFIGINGKPFIRYEAVYNKDVSEDQKRAIQGALDHKLCFILGSAGTGKTTVIGQIIYNLDLRNLTYALCSFTGKAVSRIREVTKKKTPATMHRLIHDSKKLGQYTTIHYDYIIIDESSMITTTLLYEFLLAHPNINQLICVGDINQLEPIGAGTFLKQVIKSETVPVYHLTTNHRVNVINGDGILLNANKILNYNLLNIEEYEPFEFTETDNFQIIQGNIDSVLSILKGYYNSSISAKDLTIITPYSKYFLSDLNKCYQSIYNTNSPSITDSRGIHWKINDRVMLTKNLPDINTYNGQEGIVTQVDITHVTVDFNDTGIHKFLVEPTIKIPLTITEDELIDDNIDDELNVLKLLHSYTITIDKSQGSEWDNIIFYFPNGKESGFLNKNRIYTALTRARKFVWIVTENIDLLNSSVQRKSPYRHENLARRLIQSLPNIKPFILQPTISNVDIYDGDDNLKKYIEDDNECFYDD